jgi:hypothetical protein
MIEGVLQSEVTFHLLNVLNDCRWTRAFRCEQSSIQQFGLPPREILGLPPKVPKDCFRCFAEIILIRTGAPIAVTMIEVRSQRLDMLRRNPSAECANFAVICRVP